MLMFGLVTGDRTDRTDLKVGIRSLKTNSSHLKIGGLDHEFPFGMAYFQRKCWFQGGYPLGTYPPQTFSPAASEEISLSQFEDAQIIPNLYSTDMRGAVEESYTYASNVFQIS